MSGCHVCIALLDAGARRELGQRDAAVVIDRLFRVRQIELRVADRLADWTTTAIHT
jgi:hypothetical protein